MAVLVIDIVKNCFQEKDTCTSWPIIPRYTVRTCVCLRNDGTRQSLTLEIPRTCVPRSVIQKVTVSSLGRTMPVGNFPFLLYFPPVISRDFTPRSFLLVLSR